MSLAVLDVLDREHTVASRSFNRWLIPPAALAVHLCIGQAYATSVYKTPAGRPLRHLAHRDVGIVFSIAIVMLGLSAPRSFGTWVDRDRVRAAAMVTAALLLGRAGFLVGALGIADRPALDPVPRVRRASAASGSGSATSPRCPRLIKWFPDRPGLATGLAIMGFGGGATDRQRRCRPSSLRDVRRARLRPPLTAIASGAAVAKLFVTLGRGLPRGDDVRGGWLVRVPAGWLDAGGLGTPSDGRPEQALQSPRAKVSAANAIRTRSFWLLWVVLFCNVTAGIGILEQAAPMIQDFFRSGADRRSPPRPPPASSACSPCPTCSGGSRGRPRPTSWAVSRSTSSTWASGIVLLPAAGHRRRRQHGRCSCCLAGGDHQLLRRRLRHHSRRTSRDLFGTFEVGAIHGRLLTAWSAAGVAGP